jgi:hypothetical protein
MAQIFSGLPLPELPCICREDRVQLPHPGGGNGDHILIDNIVQSGRDS